MNADFGFGNAEYVKMEDRNECPMLIEYFNTALKHARYEILKDDGIYYGEIPECNGVYANAETLEECREELIEVLEEWILFRVHQNLPLPVIDVIEILIKEIA